ncbi:MAG: hypothetical protein DMG05_22970 [Acidobacteria bacterium]|nr:MAG: hypothetical protein DMG05_22970 [Acidobacteriota bacterium]
MRKPHKVSAYEAVDPVPSQEGSCEKIGRASWRAIASASHCLIRLGGSLALPVFCRWRWEFKSGEDPNGIQEAKTLVCPELQQQDILKSVPEAEG